MSGPSESMFQLCGMCKVASCVTSLLTHVCAEVQPVGVGQVGHAQMSVPWCWFDAFVCCELLDITGLRLLLLE